MVYVYKIAASDNASTFGRDADFVAAIKSVTVKVCEELKTKHSRRISDKLSSLWSLLTLYTRI